MVEKYKRDYPDEYSKFLDMIEWRRASLKDKKFAKADSEMRKAMTIPDKLYNLLSYVLNGTDEEKFLEPKGEMKWFAKKYPCFLIPNSY